MNHNKFIVILILSLTSIYAQAMTEMELNFNNSYSDFALYMPPTPKQEELAENLFSSIFLNNSTSNEDLEKWQDLGFAVKRFNLNQNDYLCITEILPSRREGKGLYIIKLNNNSGNIVEIPHRPTDLYTHSIGYEILTEENFNAAAWNTTNRVNADLGKEVHSYFNAFTNAVAKSFKLPKILQLHGFDQRKYNLDADLILSSTKKEDDVEHNRVAYCLGKKLKDNLLNSQQVGKEIKIYLFPKDVQKLGGVKNINAKNFYSANSNGQFYHLEMSKSMRVKMFKDQNFRSNVINCFISGIDK